MEHDYPGDRLENILADLSESPHKILDGYGLVGFGIGRAKGRWGIMCFSFNAMDDVPDLIGTRGEAVPTIKVQIPRTRSDPRPPHQTDRIQPGAPIRTLCNCTAKNGRSDKERRHPEATLGWVELNSSGDPVRFYTCAHVFRNKRCTAEPNEGWNKRIVLAGTKVCFGHIRPGDLDIERDLAEITPLSHIKRRDVRDVLPVGQHSIGSVRPVTPRDVGTTVNYYASGSGAIQTAGVVAVDGVARMEHHSGVRTIQKHMTVLRCAIHTHESGTLAFDTRNRALAVASGGIGGYAFFAPIQKRE